MGFVRDIGQKPFSLLGRHIFFKQFGGTADGGQRTLDFMREFLDILFHIFLPFQCLLHLRKSMPHLADFAATQFWELNPSTLSDILCISC